MSSTHSLMEVFGEEITGSGVALKNKSLKKDIINQLDEDGDLTIADLSRELNISTPKITSLVNELIDEGLLQDLGKIDSTGGRRASIYGLVNDACYFIGVDVKRYYINIGLLDFKKHLVSVHEKIPYPLENTQQSLTALIDTIRNFIKEQGITKDKILGIGINLSGRVNNITGYSYSYFHFHEEPLVATIEQELGIKTFLENDSNAMAYGEFAHGVVTNEKNVLFINLDYGTGSGIIVDGKVYYGKSGFSGEFGHIPFYDNEIICGCGKKGCLETEVSGQALLRKVKEKMEAGAATILTKNKGELKLEDLIEAAKQEDVLMIELLAEMGEKLGRALAVLINLFNPELVILGGTLAETGDYLRLPARSALNKYSLSLVNNDTQVKLSKLGEKAGVMGGCLIARNKVLGKMQ
ncbi:ROK family transcriptional regulator [Lacibacter sp. MH-610]|uniref:ROK family transcriptional regulator n=1 Tax=Lacibacter sp. MH-610 TaxID=3020883 RepID=UPI0038914B23